MCQLSKYFVIQSRDCDLCVCPSSESEGCCAVLSRREEKNEQQEWYCEASSKTIRCKATDKCLTIKDDGTFCLCAYDTNKQDTQRMCIVNENVEVEKKSDQALVCEEHKSNEKVRLGDKSKHCWTFKYIEAKENLFFLKNENLVLKAVEEDGSPLVKLEPQEDMKPMVKYHQVWYEGKDGGIYNASTHHRLEISHSQQSETDSGNQVILNFESDMKEKPESLKIYGRTVYTEKDQGVYLTAVGGGEVEMRKSGNNLPSQQWNQSKY